MAVWAYECRSCPPGHVWWVARIRTDEVASTTNVLRVKVGAEWRCAIVDRSHAIAVDEQLVRDAIPADQSECPECVPQPAVVRDVNPASQDNVTRTVQAAAISLAGRRLVVALVPIDVVQSPGEAEMLVADLRPRFGEVDLVLMGQDDDGAPHYYGAAELLAMLADVPVDRMPWKIYPLG